MQLKTVKKSADQENFDKMKSAYDACLNEDQVMKAGAAPLLQVLEEIKKVFPITNDANPQELSDVITLLAKYGVPSLVAAGTGADDTNPDTVVVSVAAPYSFGLPSKERYEDDKLVETYRQVTIETLAGLYPDADKASFGKIIDLEKRLAAASPSSEDREDVTVRNA